MTRRSGAGRHLRMADRCSELLGRASSIRDQAGTGQDPSWREPQDAGWPACPHRKIMCTRTCARLPASTTLSGGGGVRPVGLCRDAKGFEPGLPHAQTVPPQEAASQRDQGAPTEPTTDGLRVCTWCVAFAAHHGREDFYLSFPPSRGRTSLDRRERASRR